MKSFSRRIDLSRITLESVKDYPWFVELLRRWRPSGQPSKRNADGKVTSLRLFVREGYLSFYAAGNLIAEVRGFRGGLYEKAHWKYLGLEGPVGSDPYIRAPLCDRAEVGSALDRRIQNSLFRQKNGKTGKETHDEKVFVEELIEENPGVFDVEIALPGAERLLLDNGRLSGAPRLDLITLQPEGAGWRAVIWEAKLSENNGGKAKDGYEPQTKLQFDAYKRWFAVEEKRAALIAGSREICVALVHLHNLAVALGIPILPLGDAIRDVAENPQALRSIDPNVAYAVDCRGPEGQGYKATHVARLEEMSQGHVQTFDKGSSFALKNI